MKKIIRTDVLTNKKYLKSELVRISIYKGKTLLNFSLGRGIYFYPKNLSSEKELNILKYRVSKIGGDISSILEEIKKYLEE